MSFPLNEFIERTIDPVKKIELIIKNSLDKDLKAFYRKIIDIKNREYVADNLTFFVINYILKKVFISKSLVREHIQSYLVRFSERIITRFKQKRFRILQQKQLTYDPLEIYLPANIDTLIFYRKIISCFSKRTRKFLKEMLKRISSPPELVISLAIAIYIDNLDLTSIEEIKKYFMRTLDFLKTLLLVSSIYIDMISKGVLKIKTIKPYYKTKYLMGYSIKDIPIGTILVCIEKKKKYYVAKNVEKPIGKLFILHEKEVEEIGIVQEKMIDPTLIKLAKEIKFRLG